MAEKWSIKVSARDQRDDSVPKMNLEASTSQVINKKQDSNRSRPTEINDINDDCLLIIFSNLSVMDLLEAENVCTRWKSLSQSAWKSRKEVEILEPYSYDLLDVISRRCLRLEKLFVTCKYIRGPRNQSELGLGLPKWAKMHTLSLNYIRLTNYEMNVIGKIPNLKSLTIRCCRTASVYNLPDLPDVQYLNVDLTMGVDNKFLTRIANYWTNLEYLNISHASFVTEYGLNLISSMKQLKVLVANAIFRVSDNTLLHLCHLQELHIAKTQYVTDRGILNFIEKASNLHFLNIYNCRVTGELVKDIFEYMNKNRSRKSLDIIVNSVIGRVWNRFYIYERPVHLDVKIFRDEKDYQAFYNY